MTKENYKKAIHRYKGRTLNDELIKILADIAETEVFEFLAENSFEIWNAGCTHRLRPGSGNDADWPVCEYHNPLHSFKEYKTLKGALEYMIKQDEL